MHAVVRSVLYILLLKEDQYIQKLTCVTYNITYRKGYILV